MKDLFRNSAVTNSAVTMGLLLMLSACSGGGGAAPTKNPNQDPPGEQIQQSSQWDQMVWDKGSWK